MRSSGQGYCVTADNEGVAALPEVTALSDTLGQVAGVQNWSVSEYCSRHGRLLDARRFAGYVFGWP